jgi:hypothetical protein
MPHSPPPQLTVTLCCRPSSRAFSAGAARRRLPLITLAKIDREVVAQLLCYFRSLLPCNTCRLASLYLAFPTLPHLSSVLAGQQVVGRCVGPGTLVPRARCEHVMNMGHCGHARVSDLVAQASHEPLSPLFAPALLQFACSLSLNLVSCCEARAMPCACNWAPRVMDSRAVSTGLCFTHGNPALQPRYFAMDNTTSPAHASLRSWACLVASPPFINH